MTTNLSQQRRERLLTNIKIMREKLESDPELIRSLADIENELRNKKYGLIWEEHEERVDEEIKTKIPVFVEEKELEIKKDKNKPINFLLEGDNLHSLYLLEKTHKGMIDLIYIDPPYNTGNKDFMYDDTFIDREDGFKHSKWLSFVEKRIKIAKKLMTEDGLIIIHIDENEVHQLKLLCDEVFGEKNFVGEFIWKARSGKSGTNSFIAIEHEYILCYTKNIELVNFVVEENISNKIKTEQLRQWGQSVYREDRPTMFFPILYKDEQFSLIPEEEMNKIYNDSKFDDQYVEALKEKYTNKGYTVIFPIVDDKYGRWRKSYKGIQDLIKNKELIININNEKMEIKKILPAGKVTYSAINSIISTYGTASNGTIEIKEVFNGKKVFNTTKPLQIAKYLISLSVFNKKEATILDFFAGSGTTGHAVLDMNKEDGGNRQFILCTNNESNICKDITYKRIQKVIEGYSNVEGIPANLKYYTTEFIDRFNHKDDQYYIINELSKYIKELVQLEKGVDISDKSVQVLFTDEDVDKFYKDTDAVNNCKTLYVDTNALITDEQMNFFIDNDMKICYIPEYYFEDEILEVEQW